MELDAAQAGCRIDIAFEAPPFHGARRQEEDIMNDKVENV